MKHAWFRAKKYGYGWGLPATWQGWTIFIAYLIFIIWDFVRIDKTSHSVSDTLRPVIIQFIIATGILLIIIYFTGEKLMWRWGNTTSTKRNKKSRKSKKYRK